MSAEILYALLAAVVGIAAGHGGLLSKLPWLKNLFSAKAALSLDQLLGKKEEPAATASGLLSSEQRGALVQAIAAKVEEQLASMVKGHLSEFLSNLGPKK